MRLALVASLLGTCALAADQQEGVDRAKAMADRLIASLPTQLATLPGDHSDRLRAGIAHLGADSVRELASMRAAIGQSPSPAHFPPLLVFAVVGRQWRTEDDPKAIVPVAMPVWGYFVSDLMTSDYRAWSLGGNGGVLGQKLVPYVRDRYLELAGDFYGLLTAPGTSPGIGLARALGIVAAPSPALQRADRAPGATAAIPSEASPGQGTRDHGSLNLLMATGNLSTELIGQKVQAGLGDLLVLEQLIAASSASGQPLPTDGALGDKAIEKFGLALGGIASSRYAGTVSVTEDDPLPATSGVYAKARAIVASRFNKRYTLGADEVTNAEYELQLAETEFAELVLSPAYLDAGDVVTAIGNITEVSSLVGIAVAQGLQTVGDQADTDLDKELTEIDQAESGSIQWAEDVSWKGSGDDRWFDREQYNQLCAILRPGYQVARQRAAQYFRLRLEAGYVIPRSALRAADAKLYASFSSRLDGLLLNGKVLPESLPSKARVPRLGRLHRAALESLLTDIAAVQAAIVQSSAKDGETASDGYRTAAELLSVKAWSNQVLLGSQLAKLPAGPAARISLAGTLTAVWAGTVMSSGLFPHEMGEAADAVADGAQRLRIHMVALADLGNTSLAARARGIPDSDPDVQATAEMRQRLFGADGQLATDLLELQRALEKLSALVDKSQPVEASNPVVIGEPTISLGDYCSAQRGLAAQCLGTYAEARGLRILALLTGHSLGMSSRNLVLRTAAFGWSNRLFPTGSAFALRVRDVRQNLTGSLAATLTAIGSESDAGDPKAVIGDAGDVLAGMQSGALTGILPSGSRPSLPYLHTTLGDAAAPAAAGQQAVDWAMRLYRSTDRIAWSSYQAIALRTALVTTDSLTSAIYAAAQSEAVRAEDVQSVKRAYQFIGDDE